MQNQNVTGKDPYIKIDKEKGVVELGGFSIPENTHVFYRKFFEILDNYISSPANETALILKFIYLNSTSKIYVLDIIRKIAACKNTKLDVTWYFEEDDEDIEELGKTYEEITKVPFKHIMTKSE